MPDFLGSLLVFTVILTIFLYSWSTVLDNRNKFGPEEDIRRDAHYTATFLVSTPGYPENWDNTTVEIPGFASPENVLQPGKLKEFRKLEYEEQRKLLQAANFSINFTSDGSTVQLDGEPLFYGKNHENADNIIVINRNVLINKSSGLVDARMRYLVWE